MSRRLKYATFCSGIECMSVACRRLPLDPVFFSEIEPFPCAVLKAHYPTVPNLGDMSKIRRDENGNITNGTTTIPFPNGGIDILAAGCPCQDFSVAGKRAGGEEGSGTRSSLIFEFIRIVGEVRPRWFIYENVVGMLSTNEGRDFAHILLAFRDCGYSVCWRTLDAQYVRVDGMERAVPQRRRRVWVVGCLGADESVPAQILFEPDCVAGHTPPRRRAGQGFAYSLAGRDRVDAGVVGEPARCDVLNFQGSKGNNCVTDDGSCPNLNAMHGHDEGVAPTVLSDSHGTPHGVAYGIGNGQAAEAAITMKECSQTLNCMHDKQATVQCYENHAQDSRVQGPIDTAPTQGSSNANSAGVSGNNPLVIFSKVSHPKAKDGDGERWDEREVAQTRNTFDNGEKRCQEVVVSMAQNTRDEVRIVGGDGQIAGALPAEPGMKQQTYVVSTQGLDGYNQQLTGDVSPTCRAKNADTDHLPLIVSTNSNGEDVAATINANMSKLGGDNQTTFGGGYCITRREEGAHDEPQL